MSSRTIRAGGLLLGFALDAVVGDPHRGHPVAAFGRLANFLESQWYRDHFGPGALHTATLVGSAVALGRLGHRGPGWLRLLWTAACTWAVLGARSLGNEAMAVGDHLDSGDLAAARKRLTHLVGRDTSQLDESSIARAVIESVAENTSDAVVAPLLAGAWAGPAGLLGYRVINTLDAMIGHHNARYERFGTFAARLDDVANVIPARVSALLAAGAAPGVGGSVGAAVRAWRRDARHHPSPNAGQVEAAFAGALGVELGGVTVYAGRVEHRPQLGTGRAPHADDIARSVRLAAVVNGGALALSVLIGLRPSRSRRSPSSL